MSHHVTDVREGFESVQKQDAKAGHKSRTQKQVGYNKKSDIQERIISYIGEHQSISVAEGMQVLGLSKSRMSAILGEMAEIGILAVERKAKSNVYRINILKAGAEDEKGN